MKEVPNQTIDEIRAIAHKYAKKNGFILNKNKKQLEQVICGLARNYIKYGVPYCPCVPIRDGTDNTGFICPCAKHKEQLEATGHCRCRLFFKGE